jgi:hypothetical protein
VSNLSDDEIRAALHHVASRAPDPAVVRAYLAGHNRHHRERRTLLMAGGAIGVAAVIGGPAAVLLYRRRTGQPPLLASGEDVPVLPDGRTPPNLGAPAGEPAPGQGNTRFALKYRPTFMPDGYVEVYREVSVGPGAPARQTREWRASSTAPAAKAGPAPGQIRLVVAPEVNLPIGDWRRPITVNGVPAALSAKVGQIPQVIWSIGDGLNLAVEVTGVGDDSAVAQWVARSVIPDGVSSVEVPLAYGYLPPASAGEQRASLTSDGTGWTASLDVIRDGTQVAGASLGPTVAPPPGASVVAPGLRGRTGQIGLYPNDAGGWAYVDLGNGQKLSLSLNAGLLANPPARVTGDDLVRALNEMAVGPAPFVGWLGQR